MTKAQLLSAVEAKAGFVAIIQDSLASDSPSGAKQKRYLTVETLNGNGTKGITTVTYVHDTGTDEAWFYNVEPTTFDVMEKAVDQQTLDALHTYCKANFSAYFLIPDRIDASNQWAVVEAYTVSTGKLAKSLKMVYKQGANPITHVDIV